MGASVGDSVGGSVGDSVSDGTKKAPKSIILSGIGSIFRDLASDKTK